jgi:hypothetical protein
MPEQSLLGRRPSDLAGIFYYLSWDSPNLEGQVPVFISPRNRVPQLYPWALGSLYVASYDSQDYDGGILTPSTRVSLRYRVSQEAEVEVTLRPTVSRPFRLGVLNRLE